MAWLYLMIAGVLEIVWAIGLKYADGFTKLWPSVLTVAAMSASFYCLSLAVRILPIGTSYAIWTGIGALGTTVLGIILFSEPANLTRLACIALVLFGILGLKLTAGQ